MTSCDSELERPRNDAAFGVRASPAENRRSVTTALREFVISSLGWRSTHGRRTSEPARGNVRITCFNAFPVGVVSPHTGSWKRSETAAREHRPRRAAKGTASSVFAFSLAEEKGFEPLVTCATAVFKAAPKGHS